RDRPLLPQDVAHLLRAQGPQQARDPTLAAATLELHRRAAEKAHVLGGESAAEQLLDRTLQQIVRAQALDATLGLLPDLAHLRLIGRRLLRQLLDQNARAPLIVRSQENASRELLRAGEIRLERARQRIAAQRHDALIARAALVRLDGDRDAPFGADELAEYGTGRLACRLGGAIAVQRSDRRRIEPRDGAEPIIVRALGNEQAHRPIALELQRQLAAKLQSGGEQHRGCNGLAEKIPDRLRVIAMGAQLPPGAFQAHPMPADRAVLDDEATNLVAGTGLRIHPRRMGRARRLLNMRCAQVLTGFADATES